MNQLIKNIAIDAFKGSAPLRFLEAVVVSSSPIKIKLRNNDKLVIPSEVILIAEHLTKHTRQIKVNGTVETCEFMDELKNGDRVMVAAIQGGQSFFIIDRF